MSFLNTIIVLNAVAKWRQRVNKKLSWGVDISPKKNLIVSLKKLNVSRLEFCDLYVTLQPCPMCAHAISLVRIRRLYFGAYEKRYDIDNYNKNFFYKPEIISGLNEEKCSQLLKDFFRFDFLKWFDFRL